MKTLHICRFSWPFILVMMVFLSLSQVSHAQRNKKVVREAPKIFSATSDDGRFFTIDYSLKRYKKGNLVFINSLKVYHITSRKYLSKITFELPAHPDYVKFSPDAKKICVKAKGNFYLLDVKSRRPQKRFDKAYAVGFLDGGKTVVVSMKDSIAVLDAQTLQAKPKFRTRLASHYAKSLEESTNRKFLFAKTGTQCHIWDIRTKKLLKTIRAAEVRLSPDKRFIYAISYRSRLCYFDIYDANSLEQIKETDSNIYRHFSNYSFTDGSSFSPDGKFLAFCAKRYGETKGIGILDIAKGQIVLDIDSLALGENFSTRSQPYQWFKGSDLRVLEFKEKTGKVFQVNGQQTALDFRHKFMEKRISPNGKFICSFSKHASSNLITLGLNTERHSPIYVDGVKFVSFSPDSRYLFIEKKDRSHGFILTQDIKPNSIPKVYPFSTIPFIPGTENVISEDADAPAGYQHTYLTSFKHISEVTDTTQLRIHLKTIEINSDTVGIQAHLIDQNGTYYYGASAEDFRSYWCKLKVSSNENTYPNEGTDFSVTEINEQDTLPLAIVFIMDHSGSMGDERALVVQEAVEQLIQDKRDQDTVAILKYDSRVGVESELADNKALLLSRLRKEGLGDYGGGTALVDAAHEGVERLKQAENFEQKAIVIFTDGKENSSVLTKTELTTEATEAGIKIYTVAFGSEVDEDYLNSIATATHGSYYQIYETLQFLDIFDDVYRRMRNYYSIEFKADTIGEHTAILELCLPNGKDSLLIEFENDTIIQEDIVIIEDIPDDQYSNFDDAPEDGAIKLLNVNFHFASTNITEASIPEIQKAVDYMNKYSEVYIELRGHTDSIGHDHANIKLSKHRAHKIKEAMVKAGIDPKRISTKGLGESQPVATNETDEGRALNRRTEFVIVATN